MLKLTVYVPESHIEPLKQALFAAGAGRCRQYDCCAWQTAGLGQFRPLPGSQPAIGECGKLTCLKEWRLEMLCPEADATTVCEALRRAHPYEVPAFDLVRLLDPPEVAPTPIEVRLRAAVREIPDFPKPGILFRDITPVLADAALLRDMVESLVRRYAAEGITKVAAIDARGFLLAGALAVGLEAGLVPIRKQGKLPGRAWQETYELEYGGATLELHVDGCTADDRVLLFDDLLATGGTAAAAVRLLRRAGATIVGVAFLIELAAQGGRAKLGGVDAYAPLVYA